MSINHKSNNQKHRSDSVDSDAGSRQFDGVPSTSPSLSDSGDLFNDLNVIEPAIGTLRRQRLRVALKLMLFLGAFGVLFVFMSAFFSNSTNERVFETMRVPLGQHAPGTVEFYNWNGRPVLVLHRTPEQIATLDDEAGLRDPISRRSKQPEFALNSHRSRVPQWFVAIAAGTDLNCAIEFLPTEVADFRGKSWPGGFGDACRGARYDLAGRVYKDQHARKNLSVPPYTISGEYLVLGGTR